MKRPECEDMWSFPGSNVSWVCHRPQGHKGPHREHEQTDNTSWTIHWKKVSNRKPEGEK